MAIAQLLVPIRAITSPSVGGATPSLVFFDKGTPHGIWHLRSVGETFAPKAIAGYDFGRERKQDARNKH